MSVSEYDISAKITYDVSGATAALGQATRALGDTSAATARASEASAKASTNVGQFGSTVGLAGQALGKMNPALGQTVTMAGTALGSIQALTTAGMGPLGVAIGIASIAITAAASALAYFAQKQADAKKATDDATKALLHNADAFDDLTAAEQRRQNIADRFARLAGGTATGAEYRARGEQLAEELRLTQQQRAAAREAGGMDEASRSRRLELSTIEERITRDIAANEERRAAAVAAASGVQVVIEEGATLTGAAAVAADPRGHRPRRGLGGGARTASGEDTSAADTRAGDQQRAQEAADRLARLTEDMDAEAAVRTAMREQDIGEQNDAKDRAIEIAQEQRDAILEIKRQEAEELEAIQTGVAGGFAVLSDAMQVAAESSGASAEVQKRIMAGAALAEAVVMGALEIARAAASYPDVAGMVAHGTAAAAFGVAAVKAGITMGGGGASTGGGGAPAAATGGPSLSGGERERGGDTIVINWGSQGLVYAADRAQLGRDLEDLIGAGRSRLGRAA